MSDAPDLRPEPPMFLELCPFDPAGIHCWIEVTGPQEPVRRNRCLTCGRSNPPLDVTLA